MQHSSIAGPIGNSIRGYLLVAALCLSLSAGAQDDQGGGTEGDNAPGPDTVSKKFTPTIGYEVGEKFNKASTCLEEEDYECVSEILNDVAKRRDLNSYEQAWLWDMRSRVYISQDDTAGAIDAYEHIRALPADELPDAVVETSIRNLAALYLSEDDYEKGLAAYLQYMALPTITPSDEDYAQLAVIYYSMNRYAAGMPAIEKAIDLAQARGEIGEENWYLLLYYFQYQLDRRDNAIDTLSTLVENWTRKKNVIQLAGELSEREREEDTLTLYATIYEMGWFTKSSEYVVLASLYLNAGIPFKAAKVLQTGLDDGDVESNVRNWLMLAQAWTRARDDEKSLPALRMASKLSDDGEADLQLARALSTLAKWTECIDAANDAIDRGVERMDLAEMQLGQCLLNVRRYLEAQDAFRSALKHAGEEDESSRSAAKDFLEHTEHEMDIERNNRRLIEEARSQDL